MKCQSLSSGKKIRKNINLFSVEFARSLQSVKWTNSLFSGKTCIKDKTMIITVANQLFIIGW